MDGRAKGKADLPRVLLFIESSRAYGRGLLMGIAKYVRENRPWSIDYQECRLGEFSAAWLKRRPSNAVIARITDRDMAQAIVKSKRLVVDVLGQAEYPGVVAIYPDDAQVARLAAEHLRQGGFRHFAYCGHAGARYSESRLTEFRRLIQEAGYDCHVHTSPAPAYYRKAMALPAAFSWEQHGHSDEVGLDHWLQRLPRPVGIMACNSIRGQQILDACRRIGTPVPTEIAVIGCDNDEIVCELSDPPLSSVILNAVRAGHEAAALLDRMLRGKAVPARPLLIAPLGVAARRSTDVVAVEDAKIGQALQYIREHGCENMTLSALLKVTHLSRSGLHRRFAAAVGRSPKAEILRIRLERAKQLLATSDLTLAEIATRSGFPSPEHFSYLFRAKTGCTPGQFRREAKGFARPSALAQARQEETPQS